MGATNTAANQPTEDREGLRTLLHYMAPMDEKPYSYNYAPPAGVALTNRRVAKEAVIVEDARPLDGKLSLEREGFILVHNTSAVTDFFDDNEVRTVYYPECERFLRDATGAARVCVFDHIVRSAVRAKAQKGVKLPSRGAHNDYTLASAPQRVRDFFHAEAESLLKNRFAIINVWRPIRGPVRESPFAICDARTVGPEDFVASDLLYPDRKGETYGLKFNPRHRWYYFSEMQPNEAMLLKCYDSADDGRARMTAHTGFDDPNSPADAPPRESIESRAFAFFAPEK
jgi:hypothetical protein